MPLWVVFHSPESFTTDEEKQAFAKDITTLYTSVGLPAFYVVIEFIQQPHGNTWVGGEKKDDKSKPFVRMMIDHIAAKVPPTEEAYRRVTDRVEALLKPHIADKGYDWEYHIDETERGLWRVNGFVPPLHPSKGEELWFKENKAVPFE